MKVKITFTVELNDEQRLAIGHYLQHDHPASHGEILGFYQSAIEHRLATALDQPMQEYYAAQAQKYAELAGV